MKRKNSKNYIFFTKFKLNDKLSVLCCKKVYPHKVSVKNGYKYNYSKFL